MPDPSARPLPPKPLSDEELEELDSLLANLPEALEPLDASMLDGFLCGVLLQPSRVPRPLWLPRVCDIDGRPLPPDVDEQSIARLHSLVDRRHRQLDDAIERRQWFDPWVFELDEDASPSEAVYPWVAGFSAALEAFPALMAMPDEALLEPLAALYMHIDPEDLEDADELLAEIETLEPPQDLEDAVEGLVSSTLMLADVSRPQAQRRGPRQPPRKSAGGPAGSRHRGPRR